MLHFFFGSVNKKEIKAVADFCQTFIYYYYSSQRTYDSRVKEPEYWGDRKFNQPRQPVVGVTWYDAKKFADWADLILPNETQWEYSCRAGTTTHYYTGDSKIHLNRAGWYADNSGRKLHVVGKKEPNVFGLYDMHGNVWEWIEDDWHENYKGAPSDGSAWIDEPRGSHRVMRGGSWADGAEFCRAAYRDTHRPEDRRQYHGFRLACLPTRH